MSQGKTLRRIALAQLRKRGIQVTRVPSALIGSREAAELRLTIAHVVADHLARNDHEFYFVQIGGFDGRDALRELVERYELAGLVVEPQPFAFARLQEAYADHPSVTLRNVAVSDHDGVRPMYRVASHLPAWTQQLASFDVDTVRRHAVYDPDVAANIVVGDVPCVTFATLLEDASRVDLLQIDAEGYDAELVRLFDFDRWRPSIVQFEHRHLSRHAHDETIRRLLALGFRIALSQGDTIGYRDRR